MSANLKFYDAAVPPPHAPAGMDGVAVYIGGDTPHIWTAAEIKSAGVRYVLPVFVRSNPAGASATADAAAAIARLHQIGAPKGCIVSWDTETAASPTYMRAVHQEITTAGYRLMDYGSQSAVFGNQLPGGDYYWGAHWTGTEHIDAGDAGTQYVDAGPYDLDVFKPGLPFWDTRAGKAAPAGPPPRTIVNTDWQEKIMQQLPTVQKGATGSHVETVQALCIARGDSVKVDGIFGPNTTAAVQWVQKTSHITQDGIVGPNTWAALLGVA